MSKEMNSIPTNKHVLICGMTGTGKSFLCENYLRNYEYVVKLDTKNETDERYLDNRSAWEGLEEGKDFTVVRKLEDLDTVETKKIIYVPDYDEQTIDNFNQFFRWIFERGNTILWIDELMSIGTATSYPKELGRLLTQARSKNVGVWMCTQRPSGIPLICTANTSYIFAFACALPADRKRLVETSGIPRMVEMPEGYNFWYYKMGERDCTLAVLKPL